MRGREEEGQLSRGRWRRRSLRVLTSLTSSVKQSNANSCHFLQVRRSGKLCAQASCVFHFSSPPSPFVVFLLFSFSTFYFDDFAEFVCSEISCNPVIMPEGEWKRGEEGELCTWKCCIYIFRIYISGICSKLGRKMRTFASKAGQARAEQTVSSSSATFARLSEC